jgi:hypothetical protein
MTFQTGQLFAFGTDVQSQPFIYLLTVAKVDIKSKRCGIWAVKPRLLEGVEEPWLNVFLRTRHGFIRIAEDLPAYSLINGLLYATSRCFQTATMTQKMV